MFGVFSVTFQLKPFFLSKLIANTFQTIGDFGYNCLIGKCDFMHINGSNTYPRQILYGIGFAVPCFATTFSYLVIWFYMWSNNKYLKTVGHR